MSTNMVNIRGLRKSFHGDVVLSDISRNDTQRFSDLLDRALGFGQDNIAALRQPTGDS